MLKEEAVAPVVPGSVLIEAIASAVSRGTERLVLTGRVPPSEAERMRCPHQSGQFPWPVKYGYALVGRITQGPLDLIGQTVFTLHPHQDRAVVPAADVTVVPDHVPATRATLAANMETALTVVWDAGVSAGDRVLVVGAGVIGLLVARLAARIPGTEVTVADVDGGKAPFAAALGLSFATPDTAPREVDVAINASGVDAGLRQCIDAAGCEARVVEASWHGSGHAIVELGGAFHSRRLTIVSSQVSRIPRDRLPRWSYARRRAAAMTLLSDPALDRLLTHEVPFAEAPARLAALVSGDSGALAIVLRY